MKLTNPLWYLAGLLVALGSIMAATVVAAQAYDPIRAASITPATQRADAAGRTLAVFSDILQKDRTIRCRTTDRDGQHVDIPPAAIDIAVDDEGNRWHMIALLRDGTDGMKVRCVPRDKRVDNASYGYAVVSGYDGKVRDGSGIAILGSTFGAGLAVYVWWCRRQRRAWAAIDARGADDD